MTPGYQKYIESNRTLAERHGLSWSFEVDPSGNVPKEAQWSLNQMLGVPSPPSFRLTHLGLDRKCMAVAGLNSILTDQTALSKGWQDLIKAAVIEAAYIKKLSPRHISGTIVRSLKVLATACLDKEPWEINSLDLGAATSIATKLQKTPQLRLTVEGVAKTIFDTNQISLCTPIVTGRPIKIKSRKLTSSIRAKVDERKNAQKLPEAPAFWELVRIIYEERPRSFLDAMRFEIIKLMIFLGLRGTEITTLPSDWRRLREYTTSSGVRADTLGGIGYTLQVRHFAEKQRVSDHSGVLLSQSLIDVPEIFERLVVECLERVEQLTAPLRERLKCQATEDRILTDLKPNSFVSIQDLYTILTGEPFVKSGLDEKAYIENYFSTFDPEVFHDIKEAQKRLSQKALKNKVRQYFQRLSTKINAPLPYRPADAPGRVEPRRGFRLNSLMLVSDAERIIRDALPTKLSDTEPFNIEGGQSLEAHECLFLAPKRALNEGRNGGLCDIINYVFIGRLTVQDLDYFLSKKEKWPDTTIFERYGQTEADKKLSILPHDLRHLMTTELFRQGIADTIITKRFNRRSVAQSYEYDHRSLAEDLDRVTVSDDIASFLPGKAKEVYKLILSERVQGPIVHQFKEIQRNQGDEAAVTFLGAEADGFHLTPYGGCINSFVAEPCPNHLECFNNCRHLVRLGLPQEEESLKTLLHRYDQLLLSLASHPAPPGAKSNMREHAEVRIAAIRAALNTPTGEQVFPDGIDIFERFKVKDHGPFRDT